VKAVNLPAPSLVSRSSRCDVARVEQRITVAQSRRRPSLILWPRWMAGIEQFRTFIENWLSHSSQLAARGRRRVCQIVCEKRLTIFWTLQPYIAGFGIGVLLEQVHLAKLPKTPSVKICRNPTALRASSSSDRQDAPPSQHCVRFDDIAMDEGIGAIERSTRLSARFVTSYGLNSPIAFRGIGFADVSLNVPNGYQCPYRLIPRLRRRSRCRRVRILITIGMAIAKVTAITP
jgi:hypothetical protein